MNTKMAILHALLVLLVAMLVTTITSLYNLTIHNGKEGAEIFKIGKNRGNKMGIWKLTNDNERKMKIWTQKTIANSFKQTIWSLP